MTSHDHKDQRERYGVLRDRRWRHKYNSEGWRPKHLEHTHNSARYWGSDPHKRSQTLHVESDQAPSGPRVSKSIQHSRCAVKTHRTDLFPEHVWVSPNVSDWQTVGPVCVCVSTSGAMSAGQHIQSAPLLNDLTGVGVVRSAQREQEMTSWLRAPSPSGRIDLTQRTFNY